MQRRVSEAATEDLELRDLRAFCRVVDLGSITAAAEAGGETKGTISRRISRLEEQVGVPLLERSSRRVGPTEEGRVYRERVGRALATLDEAAGELREAGEDPAGHLRITAPVDVGRAFLGPIIERFAEIAPKVTVEILLTNEVIPFTAHEIDIALRAAPQLPDSALVAQRLATVAGVVVATPAYLERRGAPATPIELDRHRRAIHTAMRNRPIYFVRDGERVTWQAEGQLVVNDAAFVREVVLQGGAVGLVPRFVVDDDLATGRLVPVLADWSVEGVASIWLVHAPGALPPKVRAFRDFLLGDGQRLNGS